MITAILAIYGAAVSTMSVVFSFWYFRATGPRLQVQARFQPPVVDEEDIEKEDSWVRTLVVRVWNTGRYPVKVELGDVIIETRSGIANYISVSWRGPDLPIVIPGQSGEEWREEVSLKGELEEPLKSNKILLELVEAGNRERQVRIPISELQYVNVQTVEPDNPDSTSDQE